MIVGEDPLGFGEGHPAKLVDLPVRCEGSCLGLHRPVLNDLRPCGLRRLLEVAHLAERSSYLDPESGLFEDLADGPFDVRLAGGELSLGQAPVVVAGPVDHCDLDPVGARIIRRIAPHNPAGGADQTIAYATSHLRFFLRSSFFHTLKNLSRVSRASCASRSISRPMARLMGPLSGCSRAKARNTSCPTTASW